MIDDTFKINYKTLPIAISTETPEYTNPHNHAEFELLLFRSGTADVTVGSEEYQVGDGDMIFVNPFEVHSLKFNSSAETPSRLCICFDCGILIDKKTAERIMNRDILITHCIKKENAKYFSEIFLKVIDAYNEESEISDSEISAYLSLMFARLIKESYFCENINSQENAEFCLRVLKYIENEYEFDISSKSAADSLSYNHSYFCRVFKKNFKKTFSEYLTMYRIANSKSMLSDNKMSVAEAARKSGFGSYSYFSKCFKKYVGVLPSEYKKTV